MRRVHRSIAMRCKFIGGSSVSFHIFILKMSLQVLQTSAHKDLLCSGEMSYRDIPVMETHTLSGDAVEKDMSDWI
jgi:hypothetical protein